MCRGVVEGKIPDNESRPENGFSQDQAKPDTYTPAQTATALNISERQVLNFLNCGELVGDKDPATGRWSIPRSHVQQLRQHREEEERRKPPKPDEKNAELVEALRDQIEDLRARLDREQEANRENRRIIAGLIDRVPELDPAGCFRRAGHLAIHTGARAASAPLVAEGVRRLAVGRPDRFKFDLGATRYCLRLRLLIEDSRRRC